MRARGTIGLLRLLHELTVRSLLDTVVQRGLGLAVTKNMPEVCQRGQRRRRIEEEYTAHLVYLSTSWRVNVGWRNATCISVRTKVALSKAPSLSTHSEALVRAKRVPKKVRTLRHTRWATTHYGCSTDDALGSLRGVVLLSDGLLALVTRTISRDRSRETLVYKLVHLRDVTNMNKLPRHATRSLPSYTSTTTTVGAPAAGWRDYTASPCREDGVNLAQETDYLHPPRRHRGQRDRSFNE